MARTAAATSPGSPMRRCGSNPLHLGDHIRPDDAGPDLEHQHARWPQPRGVNGRAHAQAGFGNAVLGTVHRRGVGGNRGDENEYSARFTDAV